MPSSQYNRHDNTTARPSFQGYGAEMVTESNHRIANNLQLLIAMIAAEKKEIDDPAARQVLDRTLGRIGAISGVHRELTAPRPEGMVDAESYLRRMGHHLAESCCDPARGRRLAIHAEPIQVPARTAAALGLVVSECVLNAFKYAYPGPGGGEVRIDLRRAGPHALRLAVEDDGVGRAVHPSRVGFGTRLIEMMAQRIGAALIWEQTFPGTRCVLAAPL